LLCTEEEHARICEKNELFIKLPVKKEEQKLVLVVETEDSDQLWEASMTSPLNADIVRKMPEQLHKPSFFGKVSSPVLSHRPVLTSQSKLEQQTTQVK
jgi:hypothetical protein